MRKNTIKWVILFTLGCYVTIWYVYSAYFPRFSYLLHHVSWQSEGNKKVILENISSSRKKSNSTLSSVIAKNHQQSPVSASVSLNTTRQSNTLHTTSQSEAMPQNRTGYITVSGIGRFGNKLFQVASLLGVASRTGLKPYIDKKHLLRNVFNMTLPSSPGSTRPVTFREKRAGEYDAGVERLSPQSNYTLAGYYQSWKYFQNFSHVIRKEFKFTRDVIKKVADIVTKHKRSNRTVVGVHIRRTDMNSVYEKKRGYTSAPKEYVEKALSYFRNKYNDVTFLVCTDDRKWSSENLKASDIKVVSTGDWSVDFAILCACDHSIITSGTYGWWGAWMANGETIYYKNYPKPGSHIASFYKFEDYYPSSWIAME